MAIDLAASRWVARCGLATALLQCCAPAPAREATVALALTGMVPPEVASVSVFVIASDSGHVVASSTVPPTRTSVVLGVPAELPLEFWVVARTDRPGPPAVGTMPAYIGTVMRSIALGREQELVPITLHQAGVLTLAIHGGHHALPERIPIQLRPEDPSARTAQLELPRSLIRSGATLSLILRAGRYEAKVLGDPPPAELIGGLGLYVAAEQESVGELQVVPPVPAPPPGAPVAMKLNLLDPISGQPLDPGDRVPTTGAAPTAVSLSVVLLDAEQKMVLDPSATLRWTVSATPAAALTGPGAALNGTATGVPLLLPDFAAQGTGRAQIEVQLEAGSLSGTLAFDVLADGQLPGPPVQVVLRTADPLQLRAGTRLIVELLDAAGLYAQDFDGRLDLSKSDSWAYFPDGLGVALRPSARGRIEPLLVRASGPRELPVLIRATVTSTALPFSLGSTLSLPVLRLPP